ncbi:MAG: universal stress protein [Gammaproteobacteria bacterium]
MYKKLLVPVDLAHIERLGKALTTAADLARHYRIPVCYAGVTTALPGVVAHSPAEFTRKLEHFAKTQADQYGLDTSTMTILSHDPAIDLNDRLLKAIEDADADIVVMGSHVPGLAEHLFASHAGYVAMHSKASVLVVR